VTASVRLGAPDGALLARFHRREYDGETVWVTHPPAVPNPAAAKCSPPGTSSPRCRVGIDVRRYAWLGKHIVDSHCLTCGECVKRCPRGVLRFERLKLFKEGDE
jgi:ferredoxin